ncbi:MAG: hypothetical protein AAF353_16220, partial [Pseudomonadota bacterium]
TCHYLSQQGRVGIDFLTSKNTTKKCYHTQISDSNQPFQLANGCRCGTLIVKATENTRPQI